MSVLQLIPWPVSTVFWSVDLAQAMVFTAASEDYNLYSFDVRKLDRPLNVHMDHVAAVIDVDYSPTGKLFN